MNKKLSKIFRNSRDKGNKIDAIKSIEVTARNTNKFHDFHPHFHIIVKGKSNAELLRKEWIKLHRTDIVNSSGQKVVPFAKNGKTIEDNLKEVFKYVTKLNLNETTIEDIDTIIVSLKGTQLIQTYGTIKKIDEDEDDEILKENDFPYYESAVWYYSKEHRDYINIHDGISLLHLIHIGDVLTQPPNPN
jgi:hypothetical protein